MYKRYFISILTVFSFTVSTTSLAEATSGKDNSQLSARNSKKTVKNKKKKNTLSYNKIQKLNKSKVATATVPVKFNFTLDLSIPKISADKAYDLGYTGRDVYVAVIDSGIETAHPFFQNRVALEACFADTCPNGQSSMIGPGAARPVHWHGTHVAGIIAGKNNAFHGVAPSAKIIAINVFDPLNGATDENIVNALNWISSLSSQYNIASVNMSLGGSAIFKSTCDDYIPSMTQAIKQLKDKNIATVVASGNSYAVGMSAPACISYAVSVAATSTWTDKVTEFSNISQYTTLAAPGLTINSSKLMGSYSASSGTSMAAPHVAGAFAVYRSKFGVQSVDKVVSDFQSTSVAALDSYSGIYSKRIDFTKLFTGQDPVTTTTSTTSTTSTTTSTTTTTIPTTTTTIPSSTTSTTTSTTVTTVPVTTTTVISTNFIATPSINRIRKVATGWYGITLRYYTYANNSPYNINIYCYQSITSPVAYSTSFRYNSGTLLNYEFNTNYDINYCRATAVNSNGQSSLYSNYEEITN